MRRHEIKRPGQGRCTGLMPGQKENRDLIHHLRRGKSQPSNRIFCGHDFTRQIIGRGASRQRLCAFVCQIADQPAYHRRAATGSAGKRSWHPLGQTEECGKIDHRLAALIGFEFFKHLPRHAILNRNRKQGPKDHIRGGKAGLGLYLHPAASAAAAIAG